MHLKVGSIAAARQFYVDTVGFEVTFEFGSQALFVSAGGYHHHLGMNTWESRGAGERTPALGLGEVTIALPDSEVQPATDALGALSERLAARGIDRHLDGDELVFLDITASSSDRETTYDVVRRTAELTRVNRELAEAQMFAEEANRGKTRFLAAFGHDILRTVAVVQQQTTDHCVEALVAEGQGMRRRQPEADPPGARPRPAQPQIFCPFQHDGADSDPDPSAVAAPGQGPPPRNTPPPCPRDGLARRRPDPATGQRLRCPCPQR